VPIFSGSVVFHIHFQDLFHWTNLNGYWLFPAFHLWKFFPKREFMKLGILLLVVGYQLFNKLAPSWKLLQRKKIQSCENDYFTDYDSCGSLSGYGCGNGPEYYFKYDLDSRFPGALHR